MITPYITFNGNCKDALEFYKRVFQSEVKMLLPYGDYIPDGISEPPENLSEWVVHAEMQICGTNFWFADEVQPPTQGNMVKLTAVVPAAKEAQSYFDLLKEGGIITLPPTKTFYSAFHAGVTDKYGVGWNVVAEEAPGQ